MCGERTIFCNVALRERYLRSELSISCYSESPNVSEDETKGFVVGHPHLLGCGRPCFAMKQDNNHGKRMVCCDVDYYTVHTVPIYFMIQILKSRNARPSNIIQASLTPSVAAQAFLSPAFSLAKLCAWLAIPPFSVSPNAFVSRLCNISPSSFVTLDGSVAIFLPTLSVAST